MPKIIESLEYFECGYCHNNLKTMFKGQPSQLKRFGAGVFLLKHRTHGYILYDTGYSTAILEKGLKLALYRRLNPTFIEPREMIDQQLRRHGIEPVDIALIVLSHLHPDHIGGLSRFPQARILVSQSVFATFQRPAFRDLVLKEQLPKDFRERAEVLRMRETYEVFPFQAAVDLFGDQSLLITELDGHAKGQLCLYLREYELFIGADACWGVELIELTPQIRAIPALIQNEMSAYRKSVTVLNALLDAEIQVVVSHDPAERIRRILDESKAKNIESVHDDPLVSAL